MTMRHRCMAICAARSLLATAVLARQARGSGRLQPRLASAAPADRPGTTSGVTGVSQKAFPRIAVQFE